MCATNVSPRTVPRKFNVVVASWVPSFVPTESPSIFGKTDGSLFAQTTPKISHEPYKRNVTAEARALSSVVREDALDTVDQFHELVKYCEKFTPKRLVDTSTPTAIKILKFNDSFPPDLEYSFFIRDDLHVEAYGGHMKVVTRDHISGVFKYCDSVFPS